MFRLIDNAVAPHRPRYETAVNHLPEAHQRAQEAAIGHLFLAVVDAAEQGGFSTDPLHVDWRDGQPAVALDDSEAGDKAFDQEYGISNGKEDFTPDPVLRTAIYAGRPQADAIYRDELLGGIGL